MALTGVRSFNSIFSRVLLKNGYVTSAVGQIRNKGSCSPVLAVSDDKSMILCWHPEIPFPYECTKPLPIKAEDLEKGELKSSLYVDEAQKYRPDGPNKEELKKMFYTTRHPFDPKPSRRYDVIRPKPSRNKL